MVGAVLACHPSELLPRLESGEAQAVVIVIEGAELPRVWAYPIDAFPSFSADPADRVTLLYYNAPLKDLILDAGAQTLALPGTTGWPLPPPQEVHGAIDRDGEPRRWGGLDRVPDSVAAIRLVAPTFEACVGGGGCLDGPPGEVQCKAPCTPPPEPDSPMPPEPIDQRPCAAGWSPRSLEPAGFECAPPPPTGCGPGAVEWPGTGTCALIGEGCASDPWPRARPARGVVYVRPGATGEGTITAPYGTIGAALTTTTATIVALSPGDHPGDLALRRGVTLLGACPATTRVLGRITVHAPVQARLIGATVSPDRAGAPTISVRSGASLSAEQVVVGDAACGAQACVVVEGRLSMNKVLFRTHHPALQIRGFATLEQVVIEETEAGVVLLAGSLLARGLAVRSSSASVDLKVGTATITEAIIEGYRGPGIAIGDGAAATLRAIHLRAAVESSLPLVGGVMVYGDARVQLEDATIVGYLDAGLWISGYGPTTPTFDRVAVRDVSIREGAPDRRAAASFGVISFSGLKARGLRVEGDRDHGVWLFGADFSLEDLAILDVRSCAQSGVSLALRGGTTGTIERAQIRGGPGAGLFLGDGAALKGQDLEIEGARQGLHLDYNPDTEDPSAQLARVQILGSKQLGVRLTRGSFQAEHLNVANTQAVAEASCGDGSAEIGISIVGDLTTTLALGHFSLRSARTGLRLREKSGFFAEDGQIIGHQLGLAAPRELDLERVKRVTFANVDDLEQD